MVKVRRRVASFLAGAAVFAASYSCAQEQNRSVQPLPVQSRSLFAQSAIQVLGSEFVSGDVSYLLFDAVSGDILASDWEKPEKPIPLGSLVKPFTALAYGEEHQFQFPEHDCQGEKTGCWQKSPHGRLNIVSAISHSCNSYFRVLAANVSGDQMAATANSFGLNVPASDLTGVPFMGLGLEWQISPSRMARAYLELVRRREQPGVREVLAGMAESAEHGTGYGVGRALKHSKALVKTGTALCTHPHAAPGDGFVIALVPADKPELLLMVRVHGVPGAKASLTAGRMLSRLEE
jgi:cell division protein FtsI/penicillin-binding protein 2